MTPDLVVEHDRECICCLVHDIGTRRPKSIDVCDWFLSMPEDARWWKVDDGVLTIYGEEPEEDVSYGLSQYDHRRRAWLGTYVERAPLN